MKAMIKLLKRAYAEEQGAEGLEKVLIIGAVVIPLLGLLIFYRKELAGWLSEESEAVINDGEVPGDMDTPDFGN